MAKLAPNKFRVSSALKTIIGKELITDDFIAVFELVKNSFDAHAKRVDIIFENIYSDDPCLIIKDNGKGMDREDLIEKWLFVAYSAKKDGTEDYRDKIQDNRTFAGAKGIGRFSCDKLGCKLTLYTRKSIKNKMIKVEVDWTDFEHDPKEEFIKVPVGYSRVASSPIDRNFKKGTILEITGLRETWDREKLLRLKHSLEKLINPNQENDPRGFSIYLGAKEEHDEDRTQELEGNTRNIVNGKIENRIFEDLKIKTTQIYTVISKDGKTIRTTLEDRGTLIYKLKEINPYKNSLKNINVNIFVLNRSAKLTFHKTMGIRSLDYGSVFLYKNGFRIHPFGEPGQDTLKMDHRKQQGTSRFFGTRDIIGRIEINGPNPDFQETSSRDGGLIRNKSYKALEEFIREYVLKRLEKFAIGVIKWGNDGDLEDHDKLNPQDMKKKASDIIYNLTRSEHLLDITYNPKLIDILKDRSESNLKTILRRLRVITEKTGNTLLRKEVLRAQKQYNSLLKAKEEAEKEASQAKEEAEQRESQNLFLKSAIPRDAKFLDNLCHSIAMYSDAMGDDIRDILQELRRDKIRKKIIRDAIKNISYHVNTISSLSRFITRANFRIRFAKTKKDLLEFIKEHLENVASDFHKKEIKIHFKQAPAPKRKFVCEFRPIEITMLIDNLISNSKKHNAKRLKAEVLSVTPNILKISFTDNGDGVRKSIVNTLFEEGITTTKGSGLGLYHVKEVLTGMGGGIEYNKVYKSGAQFIVTFRRRK